MQNNTDHPTEFRHRTSNTWTPLMKKSHTVLVGHLLEVFSHFSLEDLERVRNLAVNRPELFVRGVYESQTVPGGGCLIHHLTEGAVGSAEELARFFTGRPWHEVTDQKCYEAPKWVVRVFDGQSVALYDGCDSLPLELITDCLEFAIAAKTAEAIA